MSRKYRTIREREIDDTLVSGIRLSIEATGPGLRIRIAHPDLPCGNREFSFDDTGEFIGTGTRIFSCEEER